MSAQQRARRTPARRGLRSAAVTAVATVAAVAPLAATAAPAAAEPGWIRINAFHSNLVATVPAPWTANGLQVQQHAWGPSAWNSQWKMIQRGSSGRTFQYENRYSHQCLDVRGRSLLSGAAVVQRPCDPSSTSQRWTRIQDPVLPVWHIRNVRSGKYLKVSGGSTAAGAGFVQWNYSPTSASQMMQIW